MIHPRLHRLTAVTSGVLLAAGLSLVAPASATTAAAGRAPAQTQTPLVVNARWGGHPTYDRLVIDLKGGLPSVTVTPVSHLVYDGSGKPVPLAGKFFLQIRLNPAAAHDDAGHSVYKGPKLQKIFLPQLKGLALTGDFEGYVTFGAAFATNPYYRTFTLHSPDRFVVDFAHTNRC
ncbi:hypothetical protein ACGFYU_24445 [Streptomyces sp. NPDC048337]|uniref:AMIN-like domain-containing (lipo)protein n=1 Tax=Streptomyces sp. NPDC048337 TaxID=3365535 RepID=UPI003717E210